MIPDRYKIHHYAIKALFKMYKGFYLKTALQIFFFSLKVKRSTTRALATPSHLARLPYSLPDNQLWESTKNLTHSLQEQYLEVFS